MKRSISIIVLLFISVIAVAQTITRARFRISNRTEGFRSIDLVINNSVRIGIGNDGKIEYIESKRGKTYTLHDLEGLGMPVRFYDSFDIHDIPGKIKSIGNIKIAYNNAFDIHDKKGTLKSIGDIQIKYYNTFDIHDPQGKIKSVGPVNIRYYNSFDINDRFGDIKSIEGNTERVRVTAAYDSVS